MSTNIGSRSIGPTGIVPTAIVTGASKGLGFALAQQLADAGWNLIIDARNASELHEAAASLAQTEDPGQPEGPSQTVEAVAGDIADPAHREALIHAAGAHGRLDLLINNAGTLGPSPLPAVADFDLDALRRTVEVNTIAPLALTQLALPLLRMSRGTVIDVTSDAAVEGYPGWGGYGASKAATEQLRNVLAAEETDVIIWRVDPGDLRTAMHQAAFPGEDISDRPLPESVAPGLMRLLAARPPSGRYRLADYATTPESALVDSVAADSVAGDSAAPESTTPVVALAISDAVAVAATSQATDAADGAVRLWLTAEVDNIGPVLTFYRDQLGLPDVDGWSIDGEEGVVFAVGAAGRIEIEQMPFPETPRAGVQAAIEYASAEALDAVHARIAGVDAGAGTSGQSSIVVHDRGHAGFTATDPRGVEIYLWTEKAAAQRAAIQQAATQEVAVTS